MPPLPLLPLRPPHFAMRHPAAGHAALAALLALAACAVNQVLPGVAREVSGQRIAPYERHEECVQLVLGDWLVYRFEAQRPVAFDIHYKEGSAFIVPVSKKDVMTDDGAFRPLVPQAYCLLWEAGREGAVLDYRMLLNRSAR